MPSCVHSVGIRVYGVKSQFVSSRLRCYVAFLPSDPFLPVIYELCETEIIEMVYA